MKIQPVIIIVFILSLWTACGSSEEKTTVTANQEQQAILDTIPKKVMLYTWVNSLNMRSEPNLQSETIIKLEEGATVTYFGNEAGEVTTVNLRGKKYTSKFKEVETSNGTKGWVFGGALKPLEEKLEPIQDQAVIRLENKILTLEETNLEKLWLNELETIQAEKLNRMFRTEEISFLFNNEGHEKYLASLNGEELFSIIVDRDQKDYHVLSSVNITSEKISDQYGVFIGMTYKEIKNKRSALTQSTNKTGETIAYQRKSNIMYQLCCPAGVEKKQYSESEISDWKVKKIIWQQND